MGPGGFRYLLENGVVYENAFHAHANTETIVGHATLATGAYPSAHGLVGNVWLDRASGQMMYNIEDAGYPLLTAGANVDKATEIDPTQRVARTDGRSQSHQMDREFRRGRSQPFARTRGRPVWDRLVLWCGQLTTGSVLQPG